LWCVSIQKGEWNWWTHEEGVDSDGGLSCLAINNGQLTLTTTNLNHSVDGPVDEMVGQDTGATRQRSVALMGLAGTSTIRPVCLVVSFSLMKQLLLEMETCTKEREVG
jgi:hypothetical protein